MREGNDYVPFFVTLDKTNADPRVAYNDYFEDGFFHWESQNQIAISNPRIVKVIKEQVTPMLFVRAVAKFKSKTQRFIYAGRLANPIVDRATSNPVKFLFEPADLDGSEGEPLRSLVEWKLSGARRATVSNEVQRVIERRRATRASSGQGREADPKVRKAIELHAMRRATRHYEKDDFVVKDVSANSPYDLHCIRPGVKARKVEVKGTRGHGRTVFLTANEVQSARDVSEPTDLVVVSGIVLAEKNGEPVASGGELKVYRRWVPLEEDLKATEYRYSVPVDVTK